MVLIDTCDVQADAICVTSVSREFLSVSEPGGIHADNFEAFSAAWLRPSAGSGLRCEEQFRNVAPVVEKVEKVAFLDFAFAS